MPPTKIYRVNRLARGVTFSTLLGWLYDRADSDSTNAYFPFNSNTRAADSDADTSATDANACADEYANSDSPNRDSNAASGPEGRALGGGFYLVRGYNR